MTTENYSSIGRRLVDYSMVVGNFSKQRFASHILAPYIVSASFRLSCRDISRWLLREHSISLSANTIARIVRDSAKKSP